MTSRTPRLRNIQDFIADCHDIAARSPHVTVDILKAARLAKTFNKSAGKAPSWAEYISPAARAEPLDVTRVLFEMAMICAQQGGFITPDAAGQPQKWNINGSGAAAMLQKMSEIRDAKALPCIDIQDAAALGAALAPHLAGVPFAAERQRMFAEFASPETYAALDKLVKGSYDAQTNSHHFSFRFINDVAALFPQSFAADPFRKKIILAVLMTSSFIAARAEADPAIDNGRPLRATPVAPVASDYVLPQVLEGLGVLRYSDDLRRKIESREGFDENDPAVQDLRAATIDACALLSAFSGRPAQDIDAQLWLAGRDPAVKPTLKPAINVYTTWF